MIAFLDGTLAQSLPTHVTVEVGGVGYEVLIPLSSYDRLPVVGQRLRLLTHLQVREDAHILYGFMTDGERDLFRLLLNNVSGVGPKLALAILSGMSVANFKAAVVAGDTVAISKMRGLGKKTAERVVLELRDKVGVAAAWEVASASHAPSPAEASINDAVLALISLGYKQVEAHKAVRQVRDAQSTGDLAVDELVRRALKSL
jgi:Holliday junction DNA helicase RuvA